MATKIPVTPETAPLAPGKAGADDYWAHDTHHDGRPATAPPRPSPKNDATGVLDEDRAYGSGRFSDDNEVEGDDEDQPFLDEDDETSETPEKTGRLPSGQQRAPRE